jgi:hypothetical protein
VSAAGASQHRGDRRRLGLSQTGVTSVTNAASFDTAIPSGCLVSIFGSKLAHAESLPLPGNSSSESFALIGSQSRHSRFNPCSVNVCTGSRADNNCN